MASKATAARSATNAPASVRRNLFHHTLSRRPTSSSTSTTATTLQESPQDDSLDIVMKDRNGNYQVQAPLLPLIDEDQAQEDESSIEEKDKLETRVMEMYKDRSQHSGDPTELLTAVHASLRRKVASLADDNWKFEAEHPQSTAG